MVKYFLSFCLTLSLILLSYQPVLAVGESLYLQGRRNVTIGEKFEVVVYANTNGQQANAVQVKIIYPQGLKIISFDTSSSVLNLWVSQPAVFMGSNEITFTGGTPNPGFNGSKIILVKVRIEASSTGTFHLNFAESDMLANDGLGTSIMTEAKGLQIKVHQPPKLQKPDVLEVPKKETLNFSPVSRDSFLKVTGLA